MGLIISRRSLLLMGWMMLFVLLIAFSSDPLTSTDARHLVRVPKPNYVEEDGVYKHSDPLTSTDARHLVRVPKPNYVEEDGVYKHYSKLSLNRSASRAGPHGKGPGH